MTAGRSETEKLRSRRIAGVAMAAVIAIAIAGSAFWLLPTERRGSGPTVGERLGTLSAERAALQAKADGVARIELLTAFRGASLLFDALAARGDVERERTIDGLPAARHKAFAELDALNAALRDASERPGPGSRFAASQIADRIGGELERLAAFDDSPVVLAYTPTFIPPRRATGDLILAPGAPASPSPDSALHLGPRLTQGNSPPAPPTVPRYAPSFAGPGEDDPAVEIEIVGLRLSSPGASVPVLSIGTWRGEAVIGPERLRFSVPRGAFPTDAARTSFASGSLAVRQASRTTTFQLLFTVLPDKPGSFALDQRVRTTVPESNTLVSPEILSRAPSGETRTVRRCFDPPPGWRFDPDKRRVVIVERLGWLNDIPDETMNGGSVEFVPEDSPGQICLAVVAKPVTKAARTATIGRFEATLVRDRPVERTVQSGIRALDWNEPARLTIEPGMVEWKLYVRLFDEIDREYEGKADTGPLPASGSFLRIAIDGDGKTLVLRADPLAVR